MKTIVLIICLLILSGCHTTPTSPEPAELQADSAFYSLPQGQQERYWEEAHERATLERLVKQRRLEALHSISTEDIGMTREQAESKFGLPMDVNRSVGSWGVHEQWVYNRTYLYFENGILTSWQD